MTASEQIIDDLIDKWEKHFCRCEWIPDGKVNQAEVAILQLMLTIKIWKLLNSPVSTPVVDKK